MKKIAKNKFYMMMVGLLLGMVATAAICRDHAAQAEGIRLDPPPLLWEAAPRKKERDDYEYYRRKYHLKPKEDPDKKTAEDAGGKEKAKESDADEDDSEGEKGDVRMHKMDKPPSIMDNTLDNAAQEEGAENTEDGEKTGVIIDEQAPPCDFENVVGENIGEIDFGVFGDRPVRVVYVGQKITKDINQKRINIKVEQSGTITKIACF